MFANPTGLQSVDMVFAKIATAIQPAVGALNNLLMRFGAFEIVIVFGIAFLLGWLLIVKFPPTKWLAVIYVSITIFFILRMLGLGG